MRACHGHGAFPGTGHSRAYLGCGNAWVLGMRLEWRTSHLTGYSMGSCARSRCLHGAEQKQP